MTPAQVLQLGLVPYSEAWDLQRAVATEVAEGLRPDTILLLEHPPTVTTGRRTEESELHIPEHAEVDVVATDRGGKSTFHGTPVISQPQAGILGTYAVVKRPWVVTDELGQDVIAIRPIMNITLTYDHRLVDGALAGRFLSSLREKLENWGESDY